MDIRVTPLAFQFAMTCFLCGEPLEPDVELATAYTPTAVELGPVCTRCLESDAPNLHWRIQHHMVTLRHELAVLEHLVGAPSLCDGWSISRSSMAFACD
jgi:hypothetical protein